jgi:hypothetical protein
MRRCRRRQRKAWRSSLLKTESAGLPTSSGAPEQVLAIDWSGALAPAAQRRSIAVATAGVSGAGTSGDTVTLRRGLLRSDVEAELALLGRSGAPVVAGLDFSFSLPAHFLEQQGCAGAPELWARVAAEGERWLREPGHAHFWGRRKGECQPASHRGPRWLGYRACERAAASGGRLPGSTFQIGGAGAPGTGSLRGMPMLARLRAAGWSVWPFDPPRLPLLVEIYPRLLTGAVVKSDAAARARYLTSGLGVGAGAALPDRVRAEALAGEDAFDALVSALVMRRHAEEFAGLRQASDRLTLLEGAIWRPGGGRYAGNGVPAY